ncbi:MAG: GYF domain-containing protein [Pseudomonadota bacterium]
MSGLLEVDCSGCGRRHVTSGERARKLRVLRCECGQFVRLDRALAEHRSEPVPPPPMDVVNAGREEEDEDDATHMVSSLAAVAAMSGAGRGRSRSPQPSLVDDERVSRPVPRPSTLRSLPPAPPRQPSIAPSDKPLWYVDLGGTELVEMTIEQLILARRTGKLGEGALVWREGMPSWRPVGTLIPAASASSHPGPSPTATPSTTPAPSHPPVAAAIRTPMPGRPPAPKRTPPAPPPAEEPTPRSIASYERPLATLEFALERPEPAPPLHVPTRSPLPSIDSSAVQISRPPTPLPRTSRAVSSNAPLARPTPLPPLGSFAVSSPSRPSPLPPAPPLPTPVAYASPVPVAPNASGNDRPSQRTSLEAAGSLSERPRWVSACIALVVCVTASAAGASLVRSLKQRQQPQGLPVRAVPAPIVIATLSPTSEAAPAAAAAAAASSVPLVVDLESLSVEHQRTLPRAVRATPKPAPAAADRSDEATTNGSATESPAPDAPKSNDLPAAARANPYGPGSLIDQIKRATAEDEGGQ